MPRRKNTDGDAATNNLGQPAKQPRVRKKKEQPSSICSTPTGEHPPGGLKLEAPLSMVVGMPPGCGPVDGQMPHGMLGGPHGMHMHHPGLPNGTMVGPPQMMEDGSNGPVGLGPPFGAGPPQGPPFDFYQQAPTGSSTGPPPHFAPPMPIYSGGPPGVPQMMMQQQQPGQGMSSAMVPSGHGPGQFHPAEEQPPHTHQQMIPQMHSNHPGAHPSPMSAPVGGPQMPPHQLPPPPHPIFPGAFPRQPPGPLIMFPPPSIPQPPFLEFRLQEMNRRLYQFHCQFHQQAPSENQEQWWDAFAQEFFDDNSRMMLSLQEWSAEQGGCMTRQYTIIRRFIPRFYRSLFFHGVSQLHYVMRSPAQEMVDPQRMQNPEVFGCCALNCENLLMVTSHDRAPIQMEVHTECRLFIEFAPFNPISGYRIKCWAIELRSCQEFFASKDGMHPLDGMNDRKMQLTNLGLPHSTLAEVKMWQMMQQMQPIVERVKETSESPHIALHQIVADRMEMERQQRMAAAVAASAAVHIQTPPHSQPGGPHHPMSMMGPPQMPPMVGIPPPTQMGPGQGGPTPLQQQAPQPAAEEQKPKPKRQRQRKTAAAAASGNGTPATMPTNTSPPKGKKGAGAAVALAVGTTGQQTPPTGILQSMVPFLGAPPGQQFQPAGMPQGQYHHDVLTVGEPSMMGCEYGEQDERQISRVENTAFAMGHPSVSQGGMMLPPQGMNMSGNGSNQQTGPPMQMGLSGQQQTNDTQLLADFDIHSQQQLQHPPSSLWGQSQQSDPAQQTMSSGS